MPAQEGEPDTTPASGLDRRALLRRFAAAGAVGAVAPLTIESVLSPAAACSGPTLAASVLVGNNVWTRDAEAFGGDGAGVFNGSTTTDDSWRYRNINPFTVAARSLVVVSAAVYWGSTINLTAPTVTGPGLTFSAPTVLRIDNNSEAARGYLIVWTARNDSASPLSLVNLVINLGAGESDGFVGQVVQVVRTGSTITPNVGVIGTTTAFDQDLTTANQFVEVTGSLTPAASSGELLFAAGLADDDAVAQFQLNSLQSASWTASGYGGTPLTQSFTDGGVAVLDLGPFGSFQYGIAYDVTMGAFFRTASTGSRTARMTAAASPSGQPALDLAPAIPVDLGTVALEITCA